MIWDIVVIVTLLISAILAFFRGFVREVLTIVGVVGGLGGAYYGGPHAIPFFRSLFGIGAEASKTGNGEKAEGSGKLFDLIPYELIADGLAYGSIFVVIVVVLSVISHILASFTQNAGLGIIDRSLGVVFGIVRGVVLLGLVYLPVHTFAEVEAKKEWFDGSRSIIYVELTADALSEFFPKTETKPDKIFETKNIKKVIEAKGIVDSAQKAASELGYEDDLRDKLKDLLEENATQDATKKDEFKANE